MASEERRDATAPIPHRSGSKCFPSLFFAQLFTVISEQLHLSFPS